ncbi:MAG: molybdopterin converting factor subunit 1 [Bacteriovoracaceae bacterium]
MKITVKYFASLREKAEKTFEEIEIGSGEKLSEIYQTLSMRYAFPLSSQEVKYAVNHEYVSDDYILKERDVLVFIPPVAGG